MGALMGGGVGLTIGFIFGSYSILRYAMLTVLEQQITNNVLFSQRAGPGPRGFLATLSQYMLSSAATFSFFLAIGSVNYFYDPPWSLRFADIPYGTCRSFEVMRSSLRTLRLPECSFYHP